MKSILSLLLTLIAIVPVQIRADDQPDANTEIARGGEYRDESLQNRENRASANGNENRAQSLDNRQMNSENRQDQRQDNQSDRNNGY